MKKYLATKFELKDLGALRYFLSMGVTRSKAGISISQREYVLELLVLDCKPFETPMEPKQKLSVKGGKVVD